MLKIASFLLTYAGFALFQAVGKRQPLAAALARSPAALGARARTCARLLALVSLILACLVLVSNMGWTEACLLTAVQLIFVASLFVLLAPVLPGFVWRLALAAPAIAGMLVLGARWIP